MDDCVFCKVIKGELPSHKLYEDDLFIALLDIFPVSRGHTLIIPKKHFTWVYDVTPQEQYWKTAGKMLTAVRKALKPEWLQYFTHGIIPHAHIHIIPRYEPIKGARIIPEENLAKSISKEEFEEIAKKIKDAL